MTGKSIGIGFPLIATIFIAICPAQTTQAHPELCGRPDASIPVPEGVRWVPPPSDDGTYKSALFLKNVAGEIRIDLEVWPTMDQICPIPGNQLVLFGELNDNYGITRIDRKTGTIIDAFSGRDPMMSPDQHWLIRRPYRHFRSQRSDSEEYLLYDLTAEAAKNHMKGLTQFTEGLVGRPVYPIPHDGAPFDFEDQTPEMTHTFRSSEFHWAPDSSAVVFADSIGDKLSIVVVEIQPGGPATIALPLDISGLCEPRSGDDADYPVPVLTGVDFGTSRSLVVHFGSDNFCRATQMTLHLQDFRAPKPEVHTSRPAPGAINGVPPGGK